MIWIIAGLLLLLTVLLLFAVRPARRDHARVLLREERLEISKTREPLAEVTSHTEVVQELKSFTLPVAREELVVEKDGAEVARIPLSEERVAVETERVPLNEVDLHRRTRVEERQVEAVLKKEVARVEHREE